MGMSGEDGRQMEDTPRPRYRIELEALPDPTPVIIRLRRLLKHALRACRLRCVECRPAEEPAAATAALCRPK